MIEEICSMCHYASWQLVSSVYVFLVQDVVVSTFGSLFGMCPLDYCWTVWVNLSSSKDFVELLTTDCFLVTYFVFHSAISDNKSTLTYRTAVWPSKLHGRCRDVWQNTPWTNTHILLWLGEQRPEPQKLWERGVSNNRFIFLQRPWKTWPPSHCRSFVEEDKRSTPTEIPQPREISHIHDWCEIKQLNFRWESRTNMGESSKPILESICKHFYVWQTKELINNENKVPTSSLFGHRHHLLAGTTRSPAVYTSCGPPIVHLAELMFHLAGVRKGGREGGFFFA